MSVTMYFNRLGDDALARFLNDSEAFAPEDEPDGDSIEVAGELCLLLGDLATQATGEGTKRDLLSGAFSGFAGQRVNDDEYLIDQESVAQVADALAELRTEDLRRACDLDQLKASRTEVEDWMWDEWGPDVFDTQLKPAFDGIQAIYRGAAERSQQVLVGWY